MRLSLAGLAWRHGIWRVRTLIGPAQSAIGRARLWRLAQFGQARVSEAALRMTPPIITPGEIRGVDRRLRAGRILWPQAVGAHHTRHNRHPPSACGAHRMPADWK